MVAGGSVYDVRWINVKRPPDANGWLSQRPNATLSAYRATVPLGWSWWPSRANKLDKKTAKFGYFLTLRSHVLRLFSGFWIAGGIVRVGLSTVYLFSSVRGFTLFLMIPVISQQPFRPSIQACGADPGVAQTTSTDLIHL